MKFAKQEITFLFKDLTKPLTQSLPIVLLCLMGKSYQEMIERLDCSLVKFKEG